MEEEREGSTERIVIPLVHVGLPVRVRMNKKNAQPRGIRQIRLVLTSMLLGSTKSYY